MCCASLLETVTEGDKTHFAEALPGALHESQITNHESRMRHIFGADDFVEFFAGEVAELQGSFAQAEVLVVSLVRDLGGFVVADFRAQRGDQHQRILHVLLDALAIRAPCPARSGR